MGVREDLIAVATEIRTEQDQGDNTAARIGGAFDTFAKSMQALQVANAVAIRALTGPTNGMLVWHYGVRDFFVFDSAATGSDDGITTLIPSDSTAGRWVRLEMPSAHWRRQAQWYVDSVSGNDENLGTLVSPIRSWAELLRRVGFTAFLPQTTTINLPNGLAVGDVIRGKWEVEGAVFIVGAVATQVTTGSLTGVTPSDNATENWLYDDTGGIDFTAQEGLRMRITSGARLDAVANVGKAMSATQARGASFVSPPPLTFPVNPGGTPVSAQSGDPYAIEQLVEVDAVQLTVTHVSQPTFTTTSLFVIDLFVKDSGGKPHINRAEDSNTAFFGCKIGDGSSDLEFLGQYNITACYLLGGGFGTISFKYAGLSQLNGCSFKGFVSVGVGAQLVVDDSHVESGNFNASDTAVLTLKRVGVHDSSLVLAASGLSTLSGGRIRCLNNVWGSGHDQYGIDVEAGTSVLYSTANKPTITGTLGDTRVGGAVTAYGSVPFTETSKLAMIQSI